MTTGRARRVGEALREETADILRRVKDPRIGFVSVTGVEMSADLRQARIFVSVMGSEEERQRTMQGLESCRGHVRTELGRRVRLFRTPQISFHLDRSIDRGMHLDELLRSAQTRGGEEDATGDRGGPAKG